MQQLNQISLLREEIARIYDASITSYSDWQDLREYFWAFISEDELVFASDEQDLFTDNQFHLEVYGTWKIIRKNGTAILGFRSDSAFHHSFVGFLDESKERFE